MARSRRRNRRAGNSAWDLAVLAGALVFLGSSRHAGILNLVLPVLLLGGAALAFIWLLRFALSDAPRLSDPAPHRPVTSSSREQGTVPSDIDDDIWSPKKESSSSSPPSSWSLELLRKLEWKRFEEVAAEYLRLQGYRATTTRVGADGGIDIRIYGHEQAIPIGIAQCKAWNSKPVGVKPVRELFGVMHHENADLGIFITTNKFTEEAISFAKSHNLILVDGQRLIEEIMSLSREQQQTLLTKATAGDYTTPTCPRCDVKMVIRDSRKSGPFWGCPNYGTKKCRQTFQMANAR